MTAQLGLNDIPMPYPVSEVMRASHDFYLALKSGHLQETVTAYIKQSGLEAAKSALENLLSEDRKVQFPIDGNDDIEVRRALGPVQAGLARERDAKEAQPDPKIGIYQHYKGKYYFLQMIARHTETGEDMAVYTPLYAHHEGGRIPQIRPLKMFTEEVVFTDSVEIKMYGGERMPRFVFVGEKLPAAPKE